jgi:peptide/nickel transport system permease protein
LALFILRRGLLALLTIVGVTLLIFILVHAAGDPFKIMLAGTLATGADVRKIERELGYDAPLPIQYLRFLSGAFRGDFGLSLRYREPVTRLVLGRLPATLELAIAAMVVALVVGLPIGIISAIRQGTIVDRVGVALALLGQSIPLFWLGITLVLLLSVNLRWFPASGRGSLVQLVLPAVTLGTYPMGRLTRLVRSTVLEVIRLDYVRTANAKGLRQWTIIRRHILRNAMLPISTLLGLQFGALLGGAVVTESIFAWPGVGLLSLEAVTQRDLPLVQALVVIIGGIFIAINAAVDILYGYLDPRIRWG